MLVTRGAAFVLLILGACGGGDEAPADACVGAACAAPDASALDATPEADAGPADARPLEYPATLADTGLCVDAGCQTITPGILEYQPRWQLWTDGATKRRWLRLPPGTTIDTSDMDYWRYPVGTELWKEFTRGSTRVETRYMVKTGAADGAWTLVAYVWNAAQDLALPTVVPVPNANGTAHDVPSRNQCAICHERLPGRVLGFTALQLDYAADAGLTDLEDAIAAGLLSSPPAAGTPRFPLPGDATAQAALGYLHAHCGHCHNPMSDVQSNTPMDLRLEVGQLDSVAETPIAATTVGVTGMGDETLIIPGDAANSRLYKKFISQQAAVRMPPLGTEDTDPTGEATLAAWIESLAP